MADFQDRGLFRIKQDIPAEVIDEALIDKPFIGISAAVELGKKIEETCL